MKWLVNLAKRVLMIIRRTIVNEDALVDEVHFAIALGRGVSKDFFAQPEYYKIENLRRILVETDKQHGELNQVSLVSLIQIAENTDGWLQKADVWVDTSVFEQVRNQLPNVLWIYLPKHYTTVYIQVCK